jgi:DNA-binding transcriptional regulator YiaG
MSAKFVENYPYDGLVTTVRLPKVEIWEGRAGVGPIIDVKSVAKSTFQALSTKEATFTGKEIIFIKAYLKISNTALAKLIKTPKQELAKWEDFEDKPVNINQECANLLKQHMQNHIKEAENLLRPADKENIKPSSQSLASQGMFAGKKRKLSDTNLGNDQNQQKDNTKKRPKK